MAIRVLIASHALSSLRIVAVEAANADQPISVGLMFKDVE